MPLATCECGDLRSGVVSFGLTYFCPLRATLPCPSVLKSLTTQFQDWSTCPGPTKTRLYCVIHTYIQKHHEVAWSGWLGARSMHHQVESPTWFVHLILPRCQETRDRVVYMVIRSFIHSLIKTTNLQHYFTYRERKKNVTHLLYGRNKADSRLSLCGMLKYFSLVLAF